VRTCNSEGVSDRVGSDALQSYRRMIELCPAGRVGTPDEVANVAALLMGPEGTFITASDFLMDGGVTSSYFFGELAP
jgi:NAD(P)-dependent dehydrogenase (short-subunit alcohol dehydrogenase family)